ASEARTQAWTIGLSATSPPTRHKSARIVVPVARMTPQALGSARPGRLRQPSATVHARAAAARAQPWVEGSRNSAREAWRASRRARSTPTGTAAEAIDRVAAGSAQMPGYHPDRSGVGRVLTVS